MKVLLSYPGYDRLPAVELSNDDEGGVDDGGLDESDIVPYDPLSTNDPNHQNNLLRGDENINDHDNQQGTRENKGEVWGEVGGMVLQGGEMGAVVLVGGEEVGVAALEPTPTSMDHPEFDPLATWPDDIVVDPPDRFVYT